MAKLNQVTWYKTGYATIPVSFPNGQCTCNLCPFVRFDEPHRRHRCVLTDEYLLFPFDGRGNLCPVVFQDDKEDKQSG